MTPARGRLPWLTIAICGAGMAAAAGLFWWAGPSVLAIAQGERTERPYYIPSQSMRPTLDLYDRIMPLRVGSGGVRRGDVVVFRTRDQVRVARVAARGGDTIALHDGVVSIDGRRVSQRLVGAGPTLEGTPSRLLKEQFPGEPRAHHILDLGPGPFDDVAPVRVAGGKLYLLGDNRDRAADSRVSLAEQGVEQVRESDVIGLVDSVYWSQARSRIGRPIDEDRVQGDAQ